VAVVDRHLRREAATAAGTPFVDVEVVCSDRREHERRATSRVSDIAGLQLPSWQSIVERDYQRWEHDHITIDTARRGVNDCVEELITLLNTLPGRSSRCRHGPGPPHRR
jgi:hypothetical protein